MAAISFRVSETDRSARRGILRTPHGRIATPAFLPVGTAASVKSLDSTDLQQVGAQAVLANTYHLYLRPGAARVAKLGGLHRFMNWDGPMLTDSGGFQIFSLGFGLEHGVSKISTIFPGDQLPKATGRNKLMQVDDDGVSFRSHLNGSAHRFTAESSISIQQQLGADIILAFDECTSPLHDHHYTKDALQRTHRWAERSLAAWTNRDTQALFGIVQGGAFEDLRLQSAAYIDRLDFPGYAIGGSLGNTKTDMHRIIEWVMPRLDPAKPRHLLGIGEVADIFEGVRRGVDLFDCVAPTRQARNGSTYLSPANGGTVRNRFRLNARSSRQALDQQPLDPGCQCPTCTGYSRAYLRHLFVANELSAFRLATLHNVYFINQLLSDIRRSISDGRFTDLAKEWLDT